MTTETKVPNTPEIREEKFRAIIEPLSTNVIGSEHYEPVKNFFINEFKVSNSTKKMAKMLQKVSSMKPRPWEEIKEQVWSGDIKKQNDNRYHFIQGDLIMTTDVAFPGKAPISEGHKTWFVKTPTCDCIREEYILLSPAYKIPKSFKKGSDFERDQFEFFRQAAGFLAFYLFPIVPHDVDDELFGYFADLRTPCYILKSKK